MKKLPFFKKGKTGKINFQKNNNPDHRLSLLILILVVVITFLVLILRLFQLTIVKGEYFRRLAEDNRVKEIVIEPKRGKILDRKGFVLVKNEEPRLEKTTDRITSHRRYQQGEVAAHLIGYRQKADKKDIKNDTCQYRLKPGDKTGKKGVEKLFDCLLRGKPGKKLIEVNARNKQIKTLSIIPPREGGSLRLALDWYLQEKTYQLIISSPSLSQKKIALVGLKPTTGEILLLISYPSFDPQSFEDEDLKAITGYFKDKNKPLLNRVTKGVYPPGSTFKPFIAIAALEEEKITSKTIFEDRGTIKAGPRVFGNWYFLEYGKTEGKVDIIKALKRSNDIFFYKTGALLGPNLIRRWAGRFGFGKKTKIGLAEESGHLPSPFWKEEVLKERWFLGDTYNLSIGQGYLLVTPIQIAQATSVFANRGYLCQPKLLKTIPKNLSLKNKKTLRHFLIDYQTPNCQKLPISQKNLNLVKNGLVQACQPGGTGWPFFNFKVEGKRINVGCKTGTAQAQKKHILPYAWFTVFAPAENPNILLVVMIEKGGQGSDIAAPLAKEILKQYFKRKE